MKMTMNDQTDVADSEVTPSAYNKELSEVTTPTEVVTTLDNYTVDQILKKCENEEVITTDVPYENVRDNSKIFLIYYAKSQLRRVIKLTNYLEDLEDQLMNQTQGVIDPALLIRVIGTIQSSLNTALGLIDKVSTNDSYVKFIFQDNRKVINNIGTTTINSMGNVNLSRESRNKLRDLAESLISHMDKVDEVGDNRE